jgi:sec-independent protein translocase protein TatC
MEHVYELRRRMFFAAILFIVGFIAALVFYEPILKFLLVPSCNHLSPLSTPIVTGLTEFMGVTIKMAIIDGFALSLPMIVFQIVIFAAPAVSPKTERLLFTVLPTILIFFCRGVCLGYFMVVPTMLRFLLSFGSDIVTPMIQISDYLNIVMMLLAGLGLAFETPVIMFILTKLRLVTYKGYLHFWRYVVVLAFVIGAIFDPTPNPFDQIVVAGSISTLYGMRILIAWTMRDRPRVAVARS